jgi:hypothetical protein
VFIWGRLVQGLLRVSLVLFEDWSGVDLGLICMIFLMVYLGLRSKKQGTAEKRRSKEASKQENKEAKKQRKAEKQNAEKRRSGQLQKQKKQIRTEKQKSREVGNINQKQIKNRKHIEKQIDTIKYEEKQKGIYIYLFNYS